MTEYEIADLAASKTFEIQGVVSLLQVQIGSLSDAIDQFMYALFAFLVAAYFVGASLNRRQMWVFTGLYTMWQIWLLTALVARSVLFGEIVYSLEKLVDSSSPFLTRMPGALSSVSLFLLTTALIASIYFMWSVRHPKTE
jgi:hypothetical protein